MNPQPIFCSNNACASRSVQDPHNIRLHDSLRQRYRCRICKQTFRATEGTLFHAKK